MVVFAESYVINVELPFSEYWIPLAIGMGVGLCAVTVGKLVFGRKHRLHQKAPQTFNHDPFTQGSASEQRKSFRRQGNPTGVHIAPPENKDKPAQGLVLDRSMGGICLHVSDDYKAGAQLAVLPINAPAMTPWVDIEVRTCRQLPDGFELGCQFIKTPNWSILLMFG